MTTANDVNVLENLPLDDLFYLYEDVSAELSKAAAPLKDGEEQ